MTEFDIYLIEQLELDHDLLETALDHGGKHRLSVARALIDLKELSATTYQNIAAAYLNTAPVTAEDIPAIPLLPDVLVSKFLTRGKCLPLADDGTTLTLAMVDPFDDAVSKSVAMATKRKLAVRVIDEALWEDFMTRVYALGDVAMERLGEAFGPSDKQDDDDGKDQSSNAPVIQMVQLIISRAVQLRASDIHLEPFEKTLQLRYRIDGILVDQPPPPLGMFEALSSRLKIMADLNIAERRRPQDGRFAYRLDRRDVDLRLSTVPTVHGESIVLRLLDKTDAVFDFKALGLGAQTIAALETAISQPNGMILTTGPTGSGKTTTLYSALQALNSPERKIITIEDPVEYQLGGVNQIAVNPRIEMGFADILRNVLRQDPDVIMVGEMRDAETAEIAVRAAMTGHLVLSTVHTNTAVGAIVRLRDMGVPAFLISATLTAVLAQRLVRRVCPTCVEMRATTPVEAERFTAPPMRLAQAKGCDSCAGTGYSGRFGIYEILPVTPDLRDLIASGTSEQGLQDHARSTGHRTLLASGLDQVAAGQTTLEEIMRVVGSAYA